jgi:hypothetical protein
MAACSSRSQHAHERNSGTFSASRAAAAQLYVQHRCSQSQSQSLRQPGPRNRQGDPTCQGHPAVHLRHAHRIAHEVVTNCSAHDQGLPRSIDSFQSLGACRCTEALLGGLPPAGLLLQLGDGRVQRCSLHRTTWPCGLQQGPRVCGAHLPAMHFGVQPWSHTVGRLRYRSLRHCLIGCYRCMVPPAAMCLTTNAMFLQTCVTSALQSSGVCVGQNRHCEDISLVAAQADMRTNAFDASDYQQVLGPLAAQIVSGSSSSSADSCGILGSRARWPV